MTNIFYVVANNGTLSNIRLRNGLDQIASVALDSSGKYATITVTGTPENRWYDLEAEYTNNNGDSWFNGTSINLINNKSALLLRFPGFGGNGPEEDINNPLETQFWVNKGQNEPAYFYFVSGGQETKLALENLKSSDEQIMTVAVYEGSDAIVVEGRACGTANIQYTVNGTTYNLPVTVRLPEIACYTGQTATESAFVKEYTVTETANELYILPRDGQKILQINLLNDLNSIAKVQIAADNSYAKLIVDGNPDGLNYDYEVLMQEADGRQEYFYGNVTLYNGRPYIGITWPDENSATGHGPIDTFMNTAKGYATDVWVYLVDGSTESLLGISDLKSSDENVVKVIDPGYANGMVKLETVGWGTATVSYTSNGKTYSFDVISDVQSFGYYTAKTINKDNWIRSFTVTDDSNVFYFMADSGITFDQLMPTQELKDIATIELSADKTWVKITVTGEPQEDCPYGFDFTFSHPDGSQGEGTDILDFIKDTRTKTEAEVEVDVEALPTIDLSQPVEEVTVGVEQSTSAKALEETAKDLVDAVESGASLSNLPVSGGVAQSIKNALDNEAELKVSTSVYIDTLKKEDIQEQELLDDIAAIEKEIEGQNGLIAQYLDLGVVMTTYVDGVEDASGEVSELSQPVVFTIALPEALKKVPEGVNRTIYVIYVHDGEVKSISTTQNADGTVSFAASEFSTYALAYKDTKISDNQQNSNQDNNDQDNNDQKEEQQNAAQSSASVTTGTISPNTADTSNIFAFGLALLGSLVGLVLLLQKRKAV